MSRRVCIISLLLLATPVAPASPAIATPASISFAEQPVRLLRDKAFYLAGRGVRLADGDILESGAAAIQIDGAGASTVALGPASRLHVKIGAKATEYLLLAGWMKVQARAANGDGGATAGAAGIRTAAAGSSLILHASPGKTELFVESGAAGVDELAGGKAVRRTPVAREQYALRSAGQPLKVAPRAPREFVSAMPPAFFDALVPVGNTGKPPPPKLERPAAYAEVAPWLADQPELRQLVYRRFYPPRPRPATAPPRPLSYDR